MVIRTITRLIQIYLRIIVVSVNKIEENSHVSTAILFLVLKISAMCECYFLSMILH